jgi:uncharacterized repeat protein (TIGR01451 family)
LNAQPDLRIAKTTAITQTALGVPVIFRLAYTNTGNQAAVGVIITDTPSPQFVFYPADNLTGWVCGSGACAYPVGTVSAGATGVITIALRPMTTTLANGAVLTNTVRIQDDGTNGADPTPANNISATQVVVNDAQIVLGKSAFNVQILEPLFSPSEVEVGQWITYTLRLTNTSAYTAYGVVLTDAVPIGTLYIAGTATPTPVGTNPLVWSVGSLNPGSVYVAQYSVVVVGGPFQRTITNTAEAVSQQTGPITSNQVTHQIIATAITLVYGRVVPRDGTLVVEWMTSNEQDTLGFRVLRSASGSREDAVPAGAGVIAATGGSNAAAYTYADSGLQSDVTYTYWLQELDTSGAVASEYALGGGRVLALRMYLPMLAR